MKQKLTITIGFILFVPVLGAFIGLAYFLDYLNQSSSDEAFINVAGYQRMLSEQMQAQAKMVISLQKYEHRSGLRETITQFDHSLTVLEKGGKSLGRILPPTSDDLMGELNNIKKVWSRVKPALLKISYSPRGDDTARQAYNSANMHLVRLTSASNALVTAYENKSSEERAAVGNILFAFLLIDVILFLLGVLTIKRYQAERKLSEVEIESRAIQQAAIVELGQHALGKSSLVVIMDVAAGLVVGVLRVEYCEVLEYIPENDNFFLIAGEGWEEGLVGHALINGGSGSQAGYTLQRDRPVIITNLRNETRFNGPGLLHDHDVISGICVVINANYRAYGVLGVHTKSERIFSKDNINFLQTVSNILAEAIERDRVVHTLRRSEERFKQLANNTTEGFWISEISSPHPIYVNPAFLCIWGLSKQKDPLSDFDFMSYLIEEDDRKKFIKLIFEGTFDAPVLIEYKIRRDDGSIRWLRDKISPVYNDSNQVYRVAGLTEDVTEQKEMEVMQQLEAQKQRDSLVREVHHRIKNHLQGITGLLSNEAFKKPEIRTYLDNAIGQINAISMIHGLQGNDASENVNLSILLASISNSLEQVSLMEIQLSNNLQDTNCCYLNQDEAVPVSLILNELLQNAIKHSLPGQSDSVVQLEISKSGKVVLIRISNAVGYSFSTESLKSGKGNGLSLVRSMMPTEGAVLSIENNEGIFSIMLELQPPVIVQGAGNCGT